MENLIFIITLAIAAPVGMVIGYFGRKQMAARETDSAEAKAEGILNEAKAKSKEYVLQAKDKSIKIIDAAKAEETERRTEINHLQKRLEDREARFDQKLLELENKQQQLRDKAGQIEQIKQEIQRIKQEQIDKLEKVADLSKEDGRKILLNNLEGEMKDALVQRIKKLEGESQKELEEKARTLLSTVIQRYAASHVAETTTTTVTLPNDEMKGRIIGREGRNIKAIEQLTGVEIIVDDTPETIVISGFSPIRRHLAKRALDKLIADGRIHPSRIEDAITEAKKELSSDIKKAGEDAAYEVGVAGLDPKLIQILGRLKYRTSYGQNVLLHSIEVAQISSLLAEELGANVPVAKKGGLLHDIGKAVDHEIQGGHTEIGRDIMKKFGLPDEVAYIAVAHHEDSPKTLEGIIVKVADAISGARPGARKDSYEQYIQRLDELEQLTNSFEGIEKSYAIQAGREIRVFVKPEQIDDLKAHKLAREIADKIQSELKYPGEIKVNLIRETRVIEYAR
ncbi:MAG: ribonuclease Y [Candidatus Kerfeldbacteria bacterium CG_4_10_14_0_8_um_filter_42_10]|uniref:Ribonuclease Y n=1 Tax=Candidatus Kerfeldbacteria bacterium CG_4_10_14_0_8_um_filter_42_10 TaxID=2014248 RepID=A0A2M7RIS2_9BACT|nr:MAG: ribonuclease Y [Candidatus Kerfeldbacteria bacterium CG_4_10_14_0_8_um_filter_42_10]